MSTMSYSGPTSLFVFLQAAGGQVGLPLFVATMLVSSKVKRHMTLINFCWTWIIYSIVYCLTYAAFVSLVIPFKLINTLLRAYNGQRNFEGAGAKLCTVQAVLTHGVVPLYESSARLKSHADLTCYHGVDVQPQRGLYIYRSSLTCILRHRNIPG